MNCKWTSATYPPVTAAVYILHNVSSKKSIIFYNFILLQQWTYSSEVFQSQVYCSFACYCWCRTIFTKFLVTFLPWRMYFAKVLLNRKHFSHAVIYCVRDTIFLVQIKLCNSWPMHPASRVHIFPILREPNEDTLCTTWHKNLEEYYYCNTFKMWIIMWLVNALPAFILFTQNPLLDSFFSSSYFHILFS
jgi:hypothetical protein